MKFLELNKKRHAVKTFNDKAVDYKDLRTAIEIATLAPSANNIQPWKFVVVEDKKAELAEHLPEINKKQVEQAQYVVAIFTDTDLVQRSRKIARIGVKSSTNDILEIDKRFRPELLITVGYSDNKPEPSYRLPVDEIIERR